MNSPAVYAIGSCRIFEPLDILGAGGLITLRHKETGWHTHSTRDALQKIDLITGQREMEEWQRPLLSPEPEKNTPEAGSPDIFSTIDFFVIEISSRRSFTLNGFEIQQWCWTNLVNDAGIDLKRFTEETLRLPQDRDLSFLPPDVPELVRRLAHECQLVHQSREDIIADLHQISARLPGRHVYVPPITIPLADGTLIPERALQCEALESFCAAQGHLSFNPAPLILAKGEAEALLDHGHYTPAFKGHLASHLSNILCPFF